ncbi:MAG TPA: hypothetical protein VMI75_08155 [Polyangiaceae bacterium]|nr:hypothetical protein [Polyangiaceae bacterium]
MTRWRLAVLACCLTLCAPTVAFADDAAGADRRAQARALAENGDLEFAKGRCDRAVPLWQQAESLFPAPTLLLRVARCEALLGHVVDATATLERLLEQQLPPDAPEAFAEAREEATRSLPRVRARIATLRIDLTGEGGAVQLDDLAVRAGEPLLVDPGPHAVRVRAGDATWESNVTLGDGETRVLSVSVFSRRAAPETPTQRKVGYVLGGVGLAAVVVGSIVGATALATASSLGASCGADRSQCPPSAQSDIDSLRMRSLLADLSLGGGAALVVAGAVVTLTSPAPREPPPRLEIVPTVGGISLHGTF